MADTYQPIHGAGRQTFGLHGLWGELSAEFIGTAVLIMFGDGVVAMVVAALPGSGRTAGPAIVWAPTNWLVITFGWAFAVMVGVYVAGGISGAHINPAVTLALAFRRRFPWSSVVPYWIAQVVGAFVGAAIVYWVYHDAITAFNAAAGIHWGGNNDLATYSIFATFPAAYYHNTIGGPFLDEAVGTMLLVLGVFAVTDARNTAPLSNLGPLIVGFVVFAVGTSFGANTGYAINPARDFGPRLFIAIFGAGSVALPGTYNFGGLQFTNYFWIPIIGPLFGGCVGALTYDFFIGDVLHARKARTAAAEAVPPGRAEANVQPGA